MHVIGEVSGGLVISARRISLNLAQFLVLTTLKVVLVYVSVGLLIDQLLLPVGGGEEATDPTTLPASMCHDYHHHQDFHHYHHHHHLQCRCVT